MGTITMAEQVKLTALLKEHPNHESVSQIVEEVFSADLVFDSFKNQDKVEASIHLLNHKISRDSSLFIHNRKWLQAIAIAASLLLFIGGYWFYRLNNASKAMHIVKTSKMSKSNMVLPDGTKVWLNADTKISYSFGTKKREVELDGEAYFDVVKSKHHPFIVHTKAIDIKVLGTAFNVRAYSKEPNTQTTLLRGAVEVLLKKKNNETIFLRPNEKIVVKNNFDSTAYTTDEASTNIPEMELVKIKRDSTHSEILETLWMKPYISFDQQPLNDIIPMLENWYNVKINVLAPTLLQRRFSGKIEHESLEEVLESFKLASNLHYTVKGNTVILDK